MYGRKVFGTNVSYEINVYSSQENQNYIVLYYSNNLNIRSNYSPCGIGIGINSNIVQFKKVDSIGLLSSFSEINLFALFTK